MYVGIKILAYENSDVVKTEGKRRIHNLVEDYMTVLAKGKKDAYNEERVKIAFVVPLLEALGWNPRTDEILPEQATLTGRADFGLRCAGRTKIFVEMKSFTKNLDGHDTVKGRPRNFSEQAIQYAWGMKADWAVLTNFEETRLYDSHVKKPEEGLVWKKSIRFTEYESRFEELWLISKQSVISGALDAYKAKIQRPPVDEAFLADLMNCRQMLVENIRSNNPSLTYEQINESVQKILDRLIFIKNCEDRLIVPAESLWKRFKAWQETAIDKDIVVFMMDLRNLFRYFDQVYNGKLFEKHLCEDLKISNEVLEEIINVLYGDGQHLGYDFSVIPVDVLGQAYEQYIGSIIKEKEGYAKAVEIVTQRAKRKARGIYYTPEPIVDYMVRNTVGSILRQCKAPEDVSRIKILDPACGSGSFLIKAFDAIKEWYEEYNKLNRPRNARGTLDAHIMPVPNVEERILTENLYGVDLDPQAVEITILNLSLKAVKTKEKLPYMADHIKCGNSLIDDEEIAGKKAFKWKEQFKGIMDKGGFDVIIGNPPYGSKKMLSEEEKKFIKDKHKFTGSNDTAEMFIEKSFNLLKKDGYFGFIIPKPLTYITSWNQIREFLSTRDIKSIIDVSKAFKDVLLEQVIICVKNSPKTNNDALVGDLVDNQIKVVGKIKKEYLNKRIFQICNYGKDEVLYKKIVSGSDNLIEHFNIWAGIGGITSRLSRNKIGPIILKGKTVSRYGLTKDVWYVPSSVPNKNDIAEHDERRVVCQDIVAHITAPSPHIKITATIADKGVLTNETVINFSKKDDKLGLETLLCILNSKLMSWFVYKFIFNNAIRTMHFRPGYADYAPIGIPSNQEPFVKLCQKMMQLQKKLDDLGDKETDERQKIEEEIKKTDSEIDDEVYKIYGITETEKKIIES